MATRRWHRNLISFSSLGVKRTSQIVVAEISNQPIRSETEVEGGI